MHEQALDLAAVRMVLHRHRRNLVIVAWIGATAGLAFGAFVMPQWTSTTEVLLPPSSNNSGGQEVGREVETAVTVASSDLVLGSAGGLMDPPMSAREIAPLVTVTALTPDVLRFEAKGSSPAEAEALAQALADAEVSYIEDGSSSMTNAERSLLSERQGELQKALKDVSTEIDRSRGQDPDPSTAAGRTQFAALAQLSAQRGSLTLELDQVKEQLADTTSRPTATVLQDAAPAERPGLVRRILVLQLLGGLVAAGVAAAVALAQGRRDRRLRKRDDIADAVGSPVIAAVHSVVDGTVAGWTTVLSQYAPSKVDAWALRRGLHHLTAERSFGSRQGGAGGTAGVSHPRAVLVLSLSGDTPALAVGPQLASYMATLGVRVQLVPALRHDSADSFWAACADVASGGEPRPGLRITPGEEPGYDAEMTVLVGVLDRARPEVAEVPNGVAAVLAVSSASATDEEFAHAAVAADDAGLHIAGVVVVNPDPLDRTTGRIPRSERNKQAELPTRLTGLAAGRRDRPARRGPGELAT